MSFTGVDSLDRSIDKANAWLADIDAGFGTSDRHLAYRVLLAWLHCLRDRLTVEVAAHFAAQLPEPPRGVFFDGWNPSPVPQKYHRAEYMRRHAPRGPGTPYSDVAKAARIVTTAARQHPSAGMAAKAPRSLAGLRELLEPPAARSAAGWGALTSTPAAGIRASPGSPGAGTGAPGARSRREKRRKKDRHHGRCTTVQVQTETRAAVPEDTGPRRAPGQLAVAGGVPAGAVRRGQAHHGT